MDTTKEYILCAAIWYKKLDKPFYNCKNINSGVVICGHRHPHCIYTLLALRGLRTVTFGENAAGKHVQGFLTSKNRFVSRRLARKIAISNYQCDGKGDLFSEDLY